MTTSFRPAALLVVVFSVFSITGTARADHNQRAEVKALARRAQDQSRELYGEIQAHLRSSPHYRELLSDAAGIYRAAGHIRSVASHASRRHLDTDIHELEDLVAHVKEHAGEASHDAHGHSHGGGYYVRHSSSTRHVRQAIRELDDTVDELVDAVHDLDSGYGYEVRRPVVVDSYYPPSYGYSSGYSSSGITFGGRGFTIQLGR